MGFSEKQLNALERNVCRRNVRTRVSAGRELSYLEGWYVISVANRIFGFDGWDRETVDARCVLSRDARGSCLAVYTARVRVAVRAGERTIVREGHGTGEGRGSLVGEAHDLALKAAETDATKRALVTFGKAFGLALYANRRDQPKATPAIVESVPDVLEDGAANLSPDDSRTAAAAPTGTDATGEGPGHPNAEPSHDTRKGAVLSPPQIAPVLEAPISVRPNGVDKSVLTFSEPRRVRDKEHLLHVAAQPCLVCSARPADAHHLRFAQPRALGRKVGDEFTVPLCRQHHRELHHGGNEAAWWHDMGIDAIEVARQLWDETLATRQAGNPLPGRTLHANGRAR